MLMYKIQFVWD